MSMELAKFSQNVFPIRLILRSFYTSIIVQGAYVLLEFIPAFFETVLLGVYKVL